MSLTMEFTHCCVLHEMMVDGDNRRGYGYWIGLVVKVRGRPSTLLVLLNVFERIGKKVYGIYYVCNMLLLVVISTILTVFS